MAHDKRKCQDVINVVGQGIPNLIAYANRVATKRDQFISQSVDPTDTPLEGNVGAINAWIIALRELADSPVATAFAANVAPSHRNVSMGV